MFCLAVLQAMCGTFAGMSTHVIIFQLCDLDEIGIVCETKLSGG
jgi:hypothetical protein